MLMLNRSLRYIRCRRYEYLVKAGSISNYSFNLIDEDKVGLLAFLFEVVEYPVSREDLLDAAVSRLKGSTRETCDAVLDRLIDLEILQSVDISTDPLSLLVLADRASAPLVEERFGGRGHAVEMVAIDGGETGPSIALADVDDEVLASALRDRDYAVVCSSEFSPSLLYRVNRLCLQEGVRLIIAYLDGGEGVIVPLLDPERAGCYNDFELLRESSFFNLLDYQIMKEELIRGGAVPQVDSLCLSMLIDHVLLLLDHFSKFTAINYYAYSLDFERLVTTKTRLLKFPKCPSCQGDRNLVHPFI